MAETTYQPFGAKGRPCRLIVRRVRPTPGSQLALFVEFTYHAFITDREGEMLELEADHRRHAEIENTIRDLKYGVGLNHLPSGRFGANAAWLAFNVMAHNLARFSTRLGLGDTLITTETLRRRYLSIPGRMTRSARRLTVHLPTCWPWAETIQGRPSTPPRRRARDLNPSGPDVAGPHLAVTDRTLEPPGAPLTQRALESLFWLLPKHRRPDTHDRRSERQSPAVIRWIGA